MKMECKREAGGVSGGMVIEVTGSTYMVVTDGGEEFRCRTTPGTKTENNFSSLVAVGDRVVLKETETGTE